MGPVRQAIEKSLQEGIQKGIRQGERKKSIEIARALLSRGITIDVISDASGLPEDAIRKLSIH